MNSMKLASLTGKNRAEITRIKNKLDNFEATITDEIMNRVIALSVQDDAMYFEELYSDKKVARLGRPSKRILNPVWDHVFGIEDESEVRDIIEGTVYCLQEDVNSSHRGASLSRSKLYLITIRLQHVDATAVSGLLQCSRQMAARYVNAMEVMQPFLYRWLHQVGA